MLVLYENQSEIILDLNFLKPSLYLFEIESENQIPEALN